MGLVLSIVIALIANQKLPLGEREDLTPLLLGLILSVSSALLGWFLMRKYNFPRGISYKQGAFFVITTWLFSSTISAVVFFSAGFPEPQSIEQYSILSRFIDSFFESVSGFTTTGSTILPSIEVFPRGLLFWRVLTHWIGGMGIVYMFLTLTKSMRGSEKHKILSAEMETPDKVEFENESAVYRSGVNFMKIFFLLTVVMFMSLVVSGHFFRTIPYDSLFDNVYDSIVHSISTIGTGGFSNYNNSVSGLNNPVSEVIIAFFMLLQGVNLGLLFTAFFKHKIKEAEHNLELRIYVISTVVLTLGIFVNLLRFDFYDSGFTAIRHAFFSVTSIMSTTGLATTNFAIWPPAALSLLFVTYILGGSVGSTSGGLKVKRHLILIKFSLKEIHSYVVGGHAKGVEVDGVQYNSHDVSIIILNMIFYFAAIVIGAVLIITISTNVDFTSAIMAALASAGNIGPGLVVGSIDNGPIGNYSSFNEVAKLIMVPLMLFGRLGFLNLLILLNRYED